MRTLILLSFIFSSQVTFAIGDPEIGEALSSRCSGCHGPTGISSNSRYPNLAGQKKNYILTQLRNFKKGKRKSPVMKSIISGLEDQDYQDLAAYFSQQVYCE